MEQIVNSIIDHVHLILVGIMVDENLFRFDNEIRYKCILV